MPKKIGLNFNLMFAGTKNTQESFPLLSIWWLYCTIFVVCSLKEEEGTTRNCVMKLQDQKEHFPPNIIIGNGVVVNCLIFFEHHNPNRIWSVKGFTWFTQDTLHPNLPLKEFSVKIQWKCIINKYMMQMLNEHGPTSDVVSSSLKTSMMVSWNKISI